MNDEKKKVLVCGDCAKFHTGYCPMESRDTLSTKTYFVDEDSEVCEEFLAKDIKDLIQFFSEKLVENFTLRHFCKGNSPLGLFMWKEGRYEECEEFLRSYIESLGYEMNVESEVKTYTVNEVIEKVKRRTYTELKEEEPLMISFKNYALDWKAFLEGDLERGIIPIEDTKDKPIFHLIPHDLNVDFLKEAMSKLDVNKGVFPFAEESLSNIVNVFKEWVGDKWGLLFEIIGYCFYPDYPFNKAFMLVGNGSNGKSTYLRLVKEVLGEKNVKGSALQDICLYRFAASELYHKLANIFPDIPSKPISYTGWFKVLTGEDTISAPRKFKTSIYFKNYAKLLFSANELPQVEDMSEAFWRRWIVLMFLKRFEDNPSFFEETFPEDVIEKIIVLGLLAFVNVYKDRKFSIDVSEDFKEKWLRSANTIYAYVKEGVETAHLTLTKESYAPADHLYRDYLAWCEENDLETQTKHMFTKELERLFRIEKKRVRSGGQLVYVYSGIALGEATLTQENFEKVWNALTEAAKERGSAMTKEIAQEAGLPVEKALQVLKTLEREGKVYQPYPDFWKPYK